MKILFEDALIEVTISGNNEVFVARKDNRLSVRIKASCYEPHILISSANEQLEISSKNDIPIVRVKKR